MSESKTNPSFSLNQRDKSFIDSMVAHGRFGNKTEVVRAGLRMLEDYENNAELKRLRLAIEMADSSIREGKGIKYNNASDLAHDIIARGNERLNQSS